MDVLSDVLRTVRLTGSIFFTANFYKPWTVLAPTERELLLQMGSSAESISFFHIITEGACRFKAVNGKPFVAEKGSVVIFPHSCAHIMGSTLDRNPVPAIDLNIFEESKRFSDVDFGGQGENTRFICGYLLCDQRFNPLLGALPEVLVLSQNKISFAGEHPELKPFTLSIASNRWLDVTLQRLIDEIANEPDGSTTVATRLSELMYVEVLREYMKQLPRTGSGWLAALKDPEVGIALKVMHSEPEKKWTVSELASQVGVSRSAFAKRFSALVGESPIKYLTGWRMQLAKSLLLQPKLSLPMIAEKVGYETEYAFNKAFKRYVGEPPVAWRKGHNG